MELKKYIHIYDEVLPWNVLSSLLKYANIANFEKARVGGESENREDFNIRRTYVTGLGNNNNSMTVCHWHNLLYSFFKKGLDQYFKNNKIIDIPYKIINDIEILKYEKNGFYTWHVDHFTDIPRTMSCILLLNNDYDGGNLCFRHPDESGEWEVEVKPNRMIIWPSTFLYPHTVKPVTKGTRYSVVAWAL
jgi:hypothetical protein